MAGEAAPEERPERDRTPVAERSHGLHRFAGRVHQALDEVQDAPLWSMRDEQVTESVGELLRAKARVDGVLLRLLAEADRRDLAAQSAATTTAAWLRAQVRLTGAEAHRSVRLAQALDRDGHQAARDALAAGAVSTGQAAAVVKAVDALPADVGWEDRVRAEQHLLTEAAHHDEKALALLGQHLLEVVAPEVAEAHLARQLERQEREATKKRTLTLYDAGDGTVRGRFTVSALHGAMLQTALRAILNPAGPDALDRHEQSRCEIGAEPQRRPAPVLLGEAFESYLGRMPADRLPTTGGVNATVIVTMDLAVLEGRLKVAEILGTHQLLSPSTARRLACAAGVLPAVLDGKGHVLDLGRKARLHTTAQRHAMALQQQGTCAVQSCDRPAWACDAHHLTAWAKGGSTSLSDGVLICPRHHTLAHDPRFDLRRQPDGSLRYHRRT